MSGPSAEQAGDLVFVSYSHRDDDYRARFLTMLKPLVRNKRLDVWADPYIEVGDSWRREIDQALDRAGLGLLLVSPDFLSSDFIMDVELPALVERRARLVCVLVRPCLWQAEPMLAAVQWAHDPARDGALSENHATLESTITRVCATVDQLMHARAPAARPVVATSVPEAESLTRAAEPGRLDRVPPLPLGYVTRADEVADLKRSLLSGETGAMGLSGDPQALGLHGQGGIGKSVLAAALARDDDVAASFPDGIFWVEVGERADLVALQIDLLERVGAAQEGIRSPSQGLEALREALAERQTLLVVDDVWSAAAAEAFRATGPRGRVLYTTRDPAILDAARARAQRVDVLPLDLARELLARAAGARAAALPAEESERVLALTGRVALALALVGASVGRGGRAWRDVVDGLERGSETFLDHPYANTFKAMRVGVGALAAEDAKRYRTLAVYPEDVAVPIAAIDRLWSHLFEDSAQETTARLQALAARDLLAVDEDAVRFHDLQREFLLLETESAALLHADLLAAYRRLLPGPGARWSRLPTDEPYVWDHLPYHLAGAGERAELASTCADLAFVAIRVWLGGAHAAEADARRAAVLNPADGRLRRLLEVLRQSGHLLSDLDTLADHAATLRASIQPAAERSLDVASLDAVLGTRFLAPHWGLRRTSRLLLRVLTGHTSSVQALAFSPDGRRLASGGIDRTVRVWDPETGTELARDEDATRSVEAVAFSVDGRRLASGRNDGTVRVWDLGSGEVLVDDHGSTSWAQPLAFSVDPERLARGTGETIRAWDPGAARDPAVRERPRWMQARAYSADGRRLATADRHGEVSIWDTQSGHELARGKGHEEPVVALAFSVDGRRLASGGRDGTVRIWDPKRGEEVVPPLRHTRQVVAVAFSDDGEWLASAGSDGTVRVWDVESGRELARGAGRHTDWVRALAFSVDRRLLASASDDRTVCVWDPETGEALARGEGHTDWVVALAFSSDGRRLASGSLDDTIRLWDLESGGELGDEGDKDSVEAFAFSVDGRLLASAHSDGTVRVRDPTTGEELARGDVGDATLWFAALAFSADGRRLAGGGGDGAVRVWDAETGRELARGERHTSWIEAIAFAVDGRRLASAGNDGTVRVWDTESGEQLASGEHGAKWVLALAFSSDGRRLVSGGEDEVIRFWDPETGDELACGEGHADWVSSLAFAPDGRRLASGGHDGSVRLWNPDSGAELACGLGHAGGVAVAFAPDGRRLASGAGDGTVRLWDPETCAELACGQGHAGAVAAIEFAPDGRHLASSGDDGTIRLWDATSGTRLATIRLGFKVTQLAWRTTGLAAIVDGDVVMLTLEDRSRADSRSR